MASITVTFTHPAQTATKTATVPDDHLVRLFSALRRLYVRTGAALPGMTNAEAFDLLFAEFINQLKNRTLAEERQEAEQTATVGIAPIEAS